MPPNLRKEKSSLGRILGKLATVEGFGPTCLPDVQLLYSREVHSDAPVSYDPSIIIIAQGHKRGRLGDLTFTYDARNYLVLSVPVPFQCDTFGTSAAPLLGLAIRLNLTRVAELMLEMDLPAPVTQGAPHAIAATPLTQEMSDASLRLAKCLHSPDEARVLGPQIIREITYRALCGPKGSDLRAFATPQTAYNQIARALRRIHADYAQPLDVTTLAREAGMSLSTFHANFKSVTAKSPLRYLQTIRLHKAQVLMVGGTPVAEAARRVGYESPSQFSREFKRLFGGTPKETASRHRDALSMS